MFIAKEIDQYVSKQTSLPSAACGLSDGKKRTGYHLQRMHLVFPGSCRFGNVLGQSHLYPVVRGLIRICDVPFLLPQRGKETGGESSLPQFLRKIPQEFSNAQETEGGQRPRLQEVSFVQRTASSALFQGGAHGTLSSLQRGIFCQNPIKAVPIAPKTLSGRTIDKQRFFW